ncbi:low-density lipoprotein receptor-related protein 6-like [Glandiceps talaboti]
MASKDRYNVSSKLYWSDYGINPKIETATISGQDRTTLLSSDLDENVGRPHGLALDYQSNKLYWTDVEHEAIFSINLDGNIIVSIKEFEVPYFLYNPYYIDLDEDYFYISETFYRQILVVPRSEAKNGLKEVHNVLPWEPMGIAVFDISRQPSYNSPCASNNDGCDQLCLSTEERHQCACSHGYVLEPSGVCSEDNHLIPGQQFIIADLSQICTVPLNMADIDDVTGSINCFVDLGVTSLEYDFRQEMLYMYDSTSHSIKRMGLREGSEVEIIIFYAGTVKGIAVDWIHSTLYWINDDEGQILVSKLDGIYRTVLLDEDIDHPTAIVVHPLQEFIFWAENGTTPSINRASLSGRDRTKLVVDVIEPVAMVIDYMTNRIYWADRGKDNIEWISVDGQLREEVYYSYNEKYFTSLAIYQNILIWTEDVAEKIVFYDMDLRREKRSLNYQSSPNLIKVYAQNVQPEENVFNPCLLAHDCGMLCIPYFGVADCVCDLNNPVCTPVIRCAFDFLHGSVEERCDTAVGRTCAVACEQGFAPAIPDMTCLESGHWNVGVDQACKFALSLEHFLLVASYSGISYIDLTSTPPYYRLLPLNEDILANSLDVDFNNGMLYLTDVPSQTIRRAPLDDPAYDVIVHDGLAYPDGLVVDAANNKVYWADGNDGYIGVGDLDSNVTNILINDLGEPRALLLDRDNGVLYWTDMDSTTPKIERLRLNIDGSERETIVNTTLVHPTGLALDSKDGRLYWCDARRNVLESCELDGSDRQLIYNIPPSSSCYGLALSDDDFLYWTDMYGGSLHQLNKQSLQDEILYASFMYPTEIKLFSKPTTPSTTPISTTAFPMTSAQSTTQERDVSKTEKGPAKEGPSSTVTKSGAMTSAKIAGIVIAAVVVITILIIGSVYYIRHHSGSAYKNGNARWQMEKSVSYSSGIDNINKDDIYF